MKSSIVTSINLIFYFNTLLTAAAYSNVYCLISKAFVVLFV